MAQSPKFKKIAPRVYIASAEVCLPRSSGYGSYPCRISLRLDGREGRFYRVDRMSLSPWEAIDGGQESAPRTKREAEKVARKWLEAAREQGTLTPRIGPEPDLWDCLRAS